MNKQRRADLQRAKALIEEAQTIVAQAAEDEQEYFDNMPESLQGGDKGQAAEQVAMDLDDMASRLEDLASEVEEATQ